MRCFSFPVPFTNGRLISTLHEVVQRLAPFNSLAPLSKPSAPTTSVDYAGREKGLALERPHFS